MSDAGRIDPRVQPGGRRPGRRAPGREPERQLVRGMQMQRSAHRPGLDQRAPFPQRVADVAASDAVDARSKLELGGSLNLRMDSANVASDVDQPVGGGTIGERGAFEPARANVDPGRGRHRVSRGTTR